MLQLQLQKWEMSKYLRKQNYSIHNFTQKLKKYTKQTLKQYNVNFKIQTYSTFNRPGVAGAVLQIASWLINRLID